MNFPFHSSVPHICKMDNSSMLESCMIKCIDVWKHRKHGNKSSLTWAINTVSTWYQKITMKKFDHVVPWTVSLVYE